MQRAAERAHGLYAHGACHHMRSYPFDVVRNIMMGDHILPEERRYSGVAHCMRSLVRREGWGSLWRGGHRRFKR